MRKEKGFTLIELLVAVAFLLVIVSVFMVAMANYTLLTIKTKTFERAKDFAEEIKYIVDGMSPDHPIFNPNSFPTGKDWDTSYCDVASVACSFELNDDDRDAIPDFYDPINGKNAKSNINNIAGWVRIFPAADGSCKCQLGNCPSSIPFKCKVRYANTDIYLILTVAYVRNFKDPSILSGRAIGVTVWYFEHKSGAYKEIRSVIFKEEEG